MSPDQEKVLVVRKWPTPTNSTELRQFLGLASYRRYIHQFANVAKPLTQKNILFTWSSECKASFNTLKQKLTQAPILTFPSFHRNASPFVLETGASAVGLGAVLEQV